MGYTQEEYEEYCKKFARPPELNNMYGKQHTDESKRKDGDKTIERFKDEDFRKRHSDAVKKAMVNVDREKLAFKNRKKNKLIKCILCGTEEYVYCSKQKYCSNCRQKYSSYKLGELCKNH